MTEPTTVQLDEQIIAAGRALAAAQREPRDPAKADEAREALQVLLAQRFPDA